MPPKKQPKGNQHDLILLLLVLAVAYVALITIPIDSNYNDIHITYTVSKPLGKDVEFTNIETTIQPHTILDAPPALASVLTSGTVKISAETATVKTSKTIGEISWNPLYSSDESGTLVLRKVPTDETEITMKLYEDSKLVKTEKIYVGKDK